MTDQELIKALRCSATVHEREVDCTGRPFFKQTAVPAALIGRFGEYWMSCDCDGIALAASDRLEESASV